jgi:hypothetical protein
LDSAFWVPIEVRIPDARRDGPLANLFEVILRD